MAGSVGAIVTGPGTNVNALSITIPDTAGYYVIVLASADVGTSNPPTTDLACQQGATDLGAQLKKLNMPTFQQGLYVWVSNYITASGSVTFTVSDSSLPFRDMLLLRLDGLPSGAFDQIAGAYQNAPGTVANAISSGATGTLANASEFVVALAANGDSGSGATSPAVGTGYTTAGTPSMANAGIPFRIETKTVASTAAVTGTFTANTGEGGNEYMTVVLTFNDGGGGGTTHPLTLTANQTQTATQSRAVTPGAKSAAQTQTPSLVKGGAHPKTLSTNQTQTTARTLMSLLVRAVTNTKSTGSAPVVGPIELIENATQTQTATRVRAVGATKNVSQTQTATRLRLVTPGAKSATQTQTPTLAKGQAFIRALSASVSQAASRAFGVAKPASATEAQTPTRLRAVAPLPKSATQSSSAATARSVAPAPKTVTNAQTPSLTKGAGHFQNASAVVSQAATRALAAAKALAATQTSSPALGPRTLFRVLSATVAQTPDAQADKAGGGTHDVTLSAVVSQAATIARAVARTAAATVAQAPALVKALSPVPKAASQTQSPTMTSGSAHFVNAQATNAQVPTFARALAAARSAVVSQLGAVLRAVNATRSVANVQGPTVVRAAAPAPQSASQTQSPSSAQGQARNVSASATQTHVPVFARVLELTRSAVMTQAPAIGRSFAKQLTAAVVQVASAARGFLYSALATVTQFASEAHEVGEPTVIVPPVGRTARPLREPRIFRPQPGASATYNVQFHDATELKDCGFDFSDIVGIDETLSGVTWDAPRVLYGPSSSALPTLSQITLTGTVAVFWATGVLDGVTYAVEAHLSTSTGRNLSFVLTITGWARNLVHRFHVADSADDLDYAIDAAGGGLLLAGELISDVIWSAPVVLYGIQSPETISGHSEQHSPTVAKKSFTGIAPGITYLVAATLTITSGRVYVRKLTLAG